MKLEMDCVYVFVRQVIIGVSVMFCLYEVTLQKVQADVRQDIWKNFCFCFEGGVAR